MKGSVVKGDPRRLTCYKHDKPGRALKNFLLFFPVIRELVKSGSWWIFRADIASEADGCRAPAEVSMLRCKKEEVGEVRLQGRRVKWVDGASRLSEFQMKRELKIYVSRFVLDSGAPLVGVISTEAFLLKWARRNVGESCCRRRRHRRRCCCLWGPHSFGDTRSRM